MQKNCYHKMTFECAFCNAIKIGSQIKYMGTDHSLFWKEYCKNDSNHICYDCLNKIFCKCDKCLRYHEANTVIYIQNTQKHLCLKCIIEQNNIFVCKCCKKYFENRNSKSFCDKCFNNIYKRCKCCSRFEEKVKLIFGEYCSSCFNSKIVEVLSYSFKPSPVFFNMDEHNPLYLGVELELGNSTISNVNRFTHFIDRQYFYPKFDSSIPAFGCEVVSHPCSYEFHMNTGIWERLLQNACKYGLKANENTGIHVHMNRNFFTQEEIAILDFFINNHAGFWSEIAHRRSRYASFVNKSHDRWGIQCGSRHCALNLSNSNTIELRIFKSTTNIHEFKRILSFCSGVANFIKTNIHINDHNKEEKFIEYMKNNYDYI